MNPKRRLWNLCILVFVLTCSVGLATRYSITLLDFPGREGYTSATGLNDHGDVVGNYSGPDNDGWGNMYAHSFLWRNNSYTDISLTTNTIVYDINNQGISVGVMKGPGTGDGTSFLYDIHTAIHSVFHIPGTYYTRIEGINDSGWLTGAWYDGMGNGAFTAHPASGYVVQWNHPGVQNRGSSSTSHCINNAGDIGGFVDPSWGYGNDRGFVLSHGQFFDYEVGAATSIEAINDHGDLAGYYFVGGYPRSFTIIDGELESFGIPESIFTQVLDMNNHGWLVGSAAVFNPNIGGYIQHGFLAKPLPKGDIDENPGVNIQDMDLFSQHWLETGCQAPAFCGGCDLDKSGSVGVEDLVQIAADWLKEL